MKTLPFKIKLVIKKNTITISVIGTVDKIINFGDDNMRFIANKNLYTSFANKGRIVILGNKVTLTSDNVLKLSDNVLKFKRKRELDRYIKKFKKFALDFKTAWNLGDF